VVVTGRGIADHLGPVVNEDLFLEPEPNLTLRTFGELRLTGEMKKVSLVIPSLTCKEYDPRFQFGSADNSGDWRIRLPKVY